MLRQLESDPGDRLGEYWRVCITSVARLPHHRDGRHRRASRQSNRAQIVPLSRESAPQSFPQIYDVYRRILFDLLRMFWPSKSAYSPIHAEFTPGIDSPAEEDGFEPSVAYSRKWKSSRGRLAACRFPDAHVARPPGALAAPHAGQGLDRGPGVS